MQRLFYIVIFLSLMTQAAGQYNFMRPGIFYMPPGAPGRVTTGMNSDDVSYNPGLNFSLETGINISSLSGFNSVTSYFSPELFVPVNSKFSFEVGGIFMSTSFNTSVEQFTDRMNDFIAFARGIYTVNEKLVVYGEFAKSVFTTLPQQNSDFESITMGMEYWVTPGFRIGASVTSTTGINPYYLNSRPPFGYSVFER